METSCSRFTAAEGGTRLAAAAATKNILAVEYASFIPVRLLYEKAYQIRGSLVDGRKRSCYVTRASRIKVVGYEVRLLTDLAVTEAKEYNDIYDWCAELDKKEVLVCTAAVLRLILQEEQLQMIDINVLILDSCHMVCEDADMKYIMERYKECEDANRPIILALTYPLFTLNKKDLDKLTDKTEQKENKDVVDVGEKETEDQMERIEGKESEDLNVIGGMKTGDVTEECREVDDVKDTDRKESCKVKGGSQKITVSENEEESVNISESGSQEKTVGVSKIDTEEENICKEKDCKQLAVINRMSLQENENRDLIDDDDESQLTVREIKEVTESNENNAIIKCNEEKMGVIENLDDFEMYEKLEWRIEELEKELCCEMDLAEDIDGGKRLTASVTKPRELVIEYCSRLPDEELPAAYTDIEEFMRKTIQDAMDFIEDHRHDPTEIYGDELYEEFMNIPDPKIDPKQILNQFLYVLDQLGPYAADKAAFSLLTKLEKLKIKVPYERHFLLLCLCTTVLVKIRSYADCVFSNYQNDWDMIKTFCTPKVLRFAEILEKFQPAEVPKADTISDSKICEKDISIDTVSGNDIGGDSKVDSTAQMLSDIEKCDFNTLGNRIEDRVNTYEANLKDIDDISGNDIKDITSNKSVNTIDIDVNSQNNAIDTAISDKINTSIVSGKDISETTISGVDTKSELTQKGVIGFTRRTGHRVRGRSRVCRKTAARGSYAQQSPDALCAIVYMKEPLIANIMFMLLVDMSRCNRRLSYLCAQYCATEQPADPGTEPKECQRQGKKQEEVLKKFRMHECNLLLATSALEEGIDLPRCNLVIRWDVPPSYRSYGVCRGRARAARATAALLCSYSVETTEKLLENLATYRELDQLITRKCGCGIQDEPPQTEEDHADTFTALIKPYTPNDGLDTSKNHIKNNPKLTQEDIRKEIIKNMGDHKNKTTTDKICNDGLNTAKDKIKNDGNEQKDGLELIFDETNDNIKQKDSKGQIIAINESLTESNNECVNALLIDDGNHKKSMKGTKLVTTENILEQTHDKSHGNCIDHVNENNPEQIYKNDIDINNTNDISCNITKVNCDDKKLKDLNNECRTIKGDAISVNDIRDIKRNIKCNKCNSVKNNGIECPCVLSNNDISVSRNDSSISKCDSKKSISDTDTVASVDLSTAIALINRYCGKLPSDTFTRLAPQWSMEAVELPVPSSNSTRTAYICTLRLPLNCPLKFNIVGHPMPTKVLARRMVALQACRILHKSGELDNQLMPIGKENFKAVELEATSGYAASTNTNDSNDLNDNARPGTTKRRQYYYKRTAWAFTDCQPVEDASDGELEPPGDKEPPKTETTGSTGQKETTPGTKRNMLYAIVSKLWCALPERYNTRGRRLHAPQNARQAIGILMARHEPDNLQIPAFPVYTRSGEVRVSVEYVPDADVRLSPRRGRLVRRFMRFVFAEVLRVRRRGMKLQSEGSTHNNYYIVPTIKTTRADGSAKVDIDWSFLELIYQHTEDKKILELEKPILWPHDEEENGGASGEEEKQTKDDTKDVPVKKMKNPLLRSGETFVFDAEKYREAVVTPWYRNQDQPQFFLVAEICWTLTPDSAFPSASHTSFREYYGTKYGVTLTQRDQPLLDVDHTSARLNLLTPRYVNRKGVALPVSSERTRRAKRDRLDQKQILVPELCRVHPFAAPLWFATVALPCVLYRINALLIADEIRRAVAIDVGLGIPKITEETAPGFQWPPLDFGWSLAEVLSADSEKKKEEESKKEQKEKEFRERDEKDSQQREESESQEELKEKTINDILQEKEDAESGFEIGTWSNDMASSIPQELEYDEYMEPLPPNLTFCTSASGGTNWCEKPKNQFNPSRTFSVADSDCSFISSDMDSDNTDLDYDGTDEDTDTSGFCSSKNSNAAMGVRIEYKTAHEAEAVDLERNKKVNPAPVPDAVDDAADRAAHHRIVRHGQPPTQYVEKFRKSLSEHKQHITRNHLISRNENITQILPELRTQVKTDPTQIDPEQTIKQLFPYGHEKLTFINGQIDIESIERNKRVLLNKLKDKLTCDDKKKLNCLSMVDVDIDSKSYVNEKVVNVGFDQREKYERLVNERRVEREFVPYYEQKKGKEFDFDYQPKLEGHPGPSPSVILQALTMSNANDGINLERLETIGDSFLKFAITAYLYCAHPTVHEGKLSHMRSKQVSNLNLYRLGRSKRLGARMIASKFEPHDNWLPPCHKPPHTHHHGNNANGQEKNTNRDGPTDSAGCFIPYNLITQHSIPDKSIADCVEALIGAYLLEMGPRGALLFMSWLGIRVLPCHHVILQQPPPCHTPATQKPPPPPSPRRQRTTSSSSECSSEDDDDAHPQQESGQQYDWSWPSRPVGSLRPYKDDQGRWIQPIFGELKAPPSPLLRYIEDPEGELEQMLSGYDALERTLQYRFQDRSLLLQALTHASHHSNRLTDCYQRLEFLGDAILDYLITRHLYEDSRRHSPGALTDLRSALVNNTIFATLAARHGFHKYFRHMSPGLNEVLTKYVKIQEENGHSISEEHYLIQEDEMEQAEDVEVPKALGDLFESVAGAIFLDSGMSLDAVWKSYVNLMGAELEAFSAAAPKSPVRELLEAEPDTAKFGKPERLADGRRVRVCVEVFGRGAFKGVGRNYRIAKGTAARCALRHLRPTKGKGGLP